MRPLARRFVAVIGTLAALSLPAVGQEDGSGQAHPFPAPGGLVTLEFATGAETIWPFTGRDFSGQPLDPINLVFEGDADPRRIRQALLALDGDRSAFGFPPAFPFNCMWADAIGRHETAYAETEGWQGSAVQLQCGAYATLRVHLRLFRQGSRTLGNAHFEVLIPGTADHEVLSWQFAQTLVKVDLLRSGRLTMAPFETEAINPAPTYRTIRQEVFNGLPAELRAALGLPLENQSSPVGIPSSGNATVLSLSQELELAENDLLVQFDHPFNQVVPKPFCATAPLDFIRVVGSLHFSHRVQTNPSGRHAATFTAAGVLDVTPTDPLTGQPTGPTFSAVVSETHRSSLTDERSQARHVVLQSLQTQPAQSFFEDLSAGHFDNLVRTVECGTTP